MEAGVQKRRGAGNNPSAGVALRAEKFLEEISFRIRPRPPFRLDFTAWALRRRRENKMDSWDGAVYRRTLVLNDRPVQVEVLQQGSPERPILQVCAAGETLMAESKRAIADHLERILGLRRDLENFYSFASGDRRIAPLAHRFRGLKPPRFPTLFEAVANGIACQQLSLTVGILLLNRLAEKYGLPFAGRAGTFYSFAVPEKLADAGVEELRGLGYSTQKSRALIELARTALAEGPGLGGLEKMENDAALERLYQFRGVGRWTGEYVLLRGLGRIDVFPGDDVGARNKLQRLLRRKHLDYEGVRKITSRWQPYGGFLYLHLLLDGLAAQGCVEGRQALSAQG